MFGRMGFGYPSPLTLTLPTNYKKEKFLMVLHWGYWLLIGVVGKIINFLLRVLHGLADNYCGQLFGEITLSGL